MTSSMPDSGKPADAARAASPDRRFACLADTEIVCKSECGNCRIHATVAQNRGRGCSAGRLRWAPFGTDGNAIRSSRLGRIAVLLVLRFQACSVTCEQQVEAGCMHKQLFEQTVSHFRCVSGVARESLKFKNAHLVEARCSFCKNAFACEIHTNLDVFKNEHMASTGECFVIFDVIF